MKRLILSLTAILSMSASATAHDFWIAPTDYKMSSSGTQPVSVMVGHPKDKSRWALNPHRIISLKSLGADGITDHQSRMGMLTPKGDVLLSFKEPGTHTIMIETTSAVSVLDADEFNAYVKEEGLTPIWAARDRAKTHATPGREIYSRRGKALVQVGAVTPNHSDDVTRPLGMTLEIVPQANPYALAANAPFVSKVYYRGQPAKGVTVGLIRLDTDEGLVATQKTNAEGETIFDRPATGNWMLHAVWSDPLENNPRAEYDTIFSSLSFGFE